MRGNPQWFGKRGLMFTAPTTWRGWIYLAFWGAAIAGPALVLHEMHRAPETLIWLGASSLALAYDVKRMRKEEHSAKTPREIFVIDDDRDVTRLRSW